MDAHIPRPNIRLFAKAIQILARISDSLIIETNADRLVIRALSQSQSTYLQFTFLHSFFTSFQHQTIHTHKKKQTNQTTQQKQQQRQSTIEADDDDDDENNNDDEDDDMIPVSPALSQFSSLSSSRYFQVRVNSRTCLIPFRGSLSAFDTAIIKLYSDDEQQQQQITNNAAIQGENALVIQLRLTPVGIVKSYR